MDDVRKINPQESSIRNSNMFRFFRMVARIVANGCTHVPDEKHQIASSSNGARRERERGEIRMWLQFQTHDY
jgi:hypothetical protein